MQLLLQFSDIPLGSWIAAAAVVVIAAILIVCIIIWAKKAGGSAKKSSTKTAKPAAQTQTVKTQSTVTETAKPQASVKVEAVQKETAVASNSIPDGGKVYHVSKRSQDGKWQVKAAGGAKAIKLFDLQKDAIEYAKNLASNQDARVVVHKVDGSFRKDNY